LQDVINEIARRLDFVVKNGRYQGVKNSVGFDGIWSNSQGDIVVEIKTTDAYLIDLDTIDAYREKLSEVGEVAKNSDCLIVVGRNEKQSRALEMQLRGSRHAWSMRIISIDALIKLMWVNAETTSNEVTEKIYAILKPFEYVKVDKIVDVLFAAAEDKNSDNNEFQSSSNLGLTELISASDENLIDTRRTQGIKALSDKLAVILIKRRRTNFADQSGDIHATIAISKNYNSSGNAAYWYGYHTRQSDYLATAKRSSYMVYGMLDRSDAYAIPYSTIEKWKEHLDATLQEGRGKYWHIRVFDRGDDRLVIRLNDGRDISLDEFKVTPT
jgi:hypothetical protein